MNTSPVVDRLKLVLVLFLFVTLTSYSQLKIYCLDVNQGSATLIIAPNRETLLIDAGLKKEADEILEILQMENIRTIDYAILTHFDDDHRGGFSLLREKGITIQHPVFDHGKKAPKTYVKVVKDRQKITPGYEFKLGGDVHIKCLAAARRTERSLAPRNTASNYGENQNSVTLLIQYKGFDFFIAGDLTTNVEETLVDDGAVPDVDVYHVSHHGANTSSSEEFIQELAPEVSIVSNGTGYNHPTEPVIDVLRRNDSEIYQTNKNTNSRKWAVPIKNVSNEYIGDLDPAKDKGTILIYVDGNEYVISMERKGFNNGKTYKVEN